MKFKVFVLGLLLVVLVHSQTITGLKLSFVSIENVNPGIGVGFLSYYQLTDVFYINPSFDFLYAFGRHDYYYYRHYEYYYHDVCEIAFNLDVAFISSSHNVKPFLGFGIAPVLTTDNYHAFMNECFNMFCGFVFSKSMIELRGKVAPNGYDILKLSFGFLLQHRKVNNRIKANNRIDKVDNKIDNKVDDSTKTKRKHIWIKNRLILQR
jgi:hypothetical protein